MDGYSDQRPRRVIQQQLRNKSDRICAITRKTCSLRKRIITVPTRTQGIKVRYTSVWRRYVVWIGTQTGVTEKGQNRGF